MKFSRQLTRYASVIVFSMQHSLRLNYFKTITCLLAGLMGLIALYVSLFFLWLISINLESSFSKQGVIESQQLELGFFAVAILFLVSALASAAMQRWHFKLSYDIWTRSASAVCESVITLYRQLPDPRFGTFNRLYFDNIELSRHTVQRSRAFAAFGHYLRLSILETVKVVVFAVSLIILAPILFLLICGSFLLFLPFIYNSNRNSAELSKKMETQQKQAAHERMALLKTEDQSVDLPATQKLFEIQNLNLFQAKQNQFVVSVAGAIAVVVIALLVHETNALEELRLSGLVIALLVARMLVSSFVQLSSSLVLMSRFALLADKQKDLLQVLSGESHGKRVLKPSIDEAEVNFLYVKGTATSNKELEALIYCSGVLSDLHHQKIAWIEKKGLTSFSVFSTENKRTVLSMRQVLTKYRDELCELNRVMELMESSVVQPLPEGPELLRAKLSLSILQQAQHKSLFVVPMELLTEIQVDKRGFDRLIQISNSRAFIVLQSKAEGALWLREKDQVVALRAGEIVTTEYGQLDQYVSDESVMQDTLNTELFEI